MPDPSQASGLFWATSFGAAIGVVAGTAIQFLLTMALEARTRKRQKSAIIKELIYNQSLIDELGTEAQKLRNAINGRTFGTYFGYLNYSKALFVQASASVASGLLYELLGKENIRAAQRVVATLSVGNENWVNQEITRRRNALLANPNAFDHVEAVKFVDFIEKQIGDARTETQDLIDKLT